MKPQMTRSAGGLIDRVSSLIAGAARPWQPDPPYPSLFDHRDYDDRLERTGGVYVAWHLGVCPRWLRVGASTDIAASLKAVADLAPIASCRSNGGVFIAWTLAPPDLRAGIAHYLTQHLRPAFQEPLVAGEGAVGAATVIAFPPPPGTQDLGLT